MKNKSFGVIKISHIHFDGYVDYCFFKGLVTDNNNHIQIETTNDATDAVRFLTDDYESDKIDGIMSVVRKCYPKKGYKLSFCSVTVNVDTIRDFE